MKRPLTRLLLLLPLAATAEINGPAIVGNDYRLDLTPTVAIGPSRKIAMGGAYTAIAEGAASLADNPAGAAFRPSRSKGVFDWDGTLGFFRAAGNDIDNNGSRSTVSEADTTLNLGGIIQYGRFGVGLYGWIQRFDLKTPDGQVNRFNLSTAYVMAGGIHPDRDLAWGAGLRLASIEGMPKNGSGSRFLHLDGAAIAAGVLWQPSRGPLRVGAAYHGPVGEDQGVGISSPPATAGGLIVPRSVTVPAVVSIGVAYTWDKSPYLAQRPLLVSFDLTGTAKVENAVGIESFLEQKVQRSGEKATLAHHLGAEFEYLPRRLRLRGGTYYEPSRYAGVSGRWHGTGGFELRLFRFELFGEHHVSLSYAVDAAPRYLAHFAGLGFWHF